MVIYIENKTNKNIDVEGKLCKMHSDPFISATFNIQNFHAMAQQIHICIVDDFFCLS